MELLSPLEPPPPPHSALQVCRWHCCADSMSFWHGWEIFPEQPWWHPLSLGAQAQLHAT